MKFMILALTLCLSSVPALSKVAGGRAPFKKLTAQCAFTEDPEKSLTAEIYGKNFSGYNYSFALVSLFRYTDAAGNTQKIADYRMKYVQPAKKGAWIYDFKNTDERTALHISGDDMGGMSLLTIGQDSFELSCRIE